MSLADCDAPTSGFERTDATLVVEDVVFSGSSPTEQVQTDGSTRTLPALSATWTAPTNPYVVGVEFEYVLASGVGETVKTSAQPPQAEAWKTNNSIVGGMEYAAWYRAVGVGSDNYGDWQGPTFVTIDMDVGPYQSIGVPTFVAPAGSICQRQDVSQQYRMVEGDQEVATLSLTNPGFEAGGGSTTGWTATTGAIGAVTSYTTIVPRTGSYMLSCGATVGLVAFKQDAAIPSGLHAAVDEGWMKVKAGSGGWHNPGPTGFGPGNDEGRIGIAFLDGGGSVIGSPTYTSWNSATGWSHLTLGATAIPNGARSIRRLAEGVPEDAVHDNFFDDFDDIVLIQTVNWRLMSDLTSITINGAPLATAMTGLNFAGMLVTAVDNGDGTVTITVMPPSVTLTASEALTAGQLVSFHNSSGAKVRKADKSDDTKQPDGFVLTAVAMGDPATVYLPGGVNTAVSGLTPGALYFLGTAGGVTATPTTTPGEWLQEVGRAADATHLVFNPKGGVKL